MNPSATRSPSTDLSRKDMRSLLSTLTLTVVMVANSTGLADPPSPDTLLLNAKLWTVNPKQPEATALAVWQDRILAVGSNAEIRQLAGPQTKVIDLKGRRGVPGFYDSHVHL